MRMQWFNRLSVQRKILISNFLVVLIPIVLSVILVVSVWAMLRFTNPVMHRPWMMLAPSSIQEQLLQWSLGKLNKMQAKTTDLNVDSVRNVSSVMEALGVDLMIVNRGRVTYITPGATAEQIIDAINTEHEHYDGVTKELIILDSQQKVHYNVDNIHRLIWDNDIVQFINNYDGDDFIVASGNIPFLAKTHGKESLEKHFIEGVFGGAILFVFASIIVFGVYISNRVSSHILRPLRDLQGASRTFIEEGRFTTIPVKEIDELGQTISAFNNMQRALQEEERRRQQYEANRQAMMVGIVHDIATPLTSVKGFASALLDGLGNTEEKRQRYAQNIYDMSGKIEHLLTMLSDFSKLELGTVIYQLEDIDMTQFLTDFVAQKRDDFKDEAMQIISYIEDVQGCVHIDEQQFTRVLDNLVNNSWKYRDHDDLTVMIKGYIIDDMLHIDIEDDGPGVPAASLERIFDIFYRTDEARSDVAKGSGIGLAIAKQIVEDFNGRIWAAAPEKGLRISIALPIKRKE